MGNFMRTSGRHLRRLPEHPIPIYRLYGVAIGLQAILHIWRWTEQKYVTKSIRNLGRLGLAHKQ
jgi:hypothetical protein